MRRTLVTGGAGYKGTILVDALLKAGCDVTILDNFMYGYEPVLGFAGNRRCSIVKKDIRNLEKKDVEGYDVIYHLAGISGYPACEANPHSAHVINVTSTETLVGLLDDEQVLVYASTTSLYGAAGVELDETATPTPTSLYGVTKWQAEKISLGRPNSIAFRFATLFGASLKMRPDLLLNDFVGKAVTERSIVLFDCHSVRTFLHVRDAIAAYLMVLDQSEDMVGKVYNVGSSDMNYSKLEVAEHIAAQVDMRIIESALVDSDPRNFFINFDRISALGFRPTVSLDEGIEELVRLYSWYRPYSVYVTI
jgi:nucleoside-diphosphate-sugar epimerase